MIRDLRSPAALAVAGLGLFSAPDAAAAVAALELHYSFDSAAGTMVPDLSGNGRNGTLAGGAGISPAAARGAGSVNLDGVDDYVQVPGFDLGRQFTISVFTRMPAAGGTTGVKPILANAGPGFNAVGFRYGVERFTSVNERIFFATSNGSEGIDSGSGGPTFSAYPEDGAFHHLAVTVDLDGTRVSKYFDGFLAGIGGSNPSGPYNLTSPARVGALPTGDAWFVGQIDDLRVYRGVLTAEEIRAIPEPGTVGAAVVALTGGLLRRRDAGAPQA